MSTIIRYEEYQLQDDPCVFFHSMATHDVATLLKEGADRARIGPNGTAQDGAGFYLNRSIFDAEDEWGHKLFAQGFSIVRVTLPPTARIATEEEVEAVQQVFMPWAVEHGYARLTGYSERSQRPVYEPTDPILAAHNITRAIYEDENHFIRGIGWPATALGLYLAAQGYDGYSAGRYTVVVTNFALLTPSVFALEKTI